MVYETIRTSYDGNFYKTRETPWPFPRGVSLNLIGGGCKICTAQPYLGDTNKTKIRDTAGSMGPFTKDVRLTSGEGGLLIPDVPLLFECDSIVLCECGRGRGF